MGGGGGGGAGGGVCSLANYSVAYGETQSNRVSDFRDFVCSLFPKAKWQSFFFFFFNFYSSLTSFFKSSVITDNDQS